MLQPLPELPDELAALPALGPSQLAYVDQCILRVAATAAVNNERVYKLPKSPRARLGSLVHDLLEDVDRRSSAELLVDFDDGLDQEFGGGQAGSLRDSLPAAAVEKQRSILENRAREAVGDRTGAQGPGLPPRRGREVRLESSEPELGLAGSADLIADCPDGVVEIVDYKTGEVADADGSLRPEYAIQLQAYALMLLEREPSTRLRLVLDNGSRTEVPSGRVDLARARDEITRIRAAVPSRGVIQTSAFASPGEACRYCPVRPGCSAYRRKAPMWWSGQDAPEKMPLDTWGRVTDWRRTEEGLVELELDDAAARLVRIQGLPPERASRSDLRDLESVYFFDLNSAARRRSDFLGSPLHPRDFHAHSPSGDPSDRAWTLEVFGVSSSDRTPD